jgi:hypothetical protein
MITGVDAIGYAVAFYILVRAGKLLFKKKEKFLSERIVEAVKD